MRRTDKLPPRQVASSANAHNLDGSLLPKTVLDQVEPGAIEDAGGRGHLRLEPAGAGCAEQRGIELKVARSPSAWSVEIDGILVSGALTKSTKPMGESAILRALFPRNGEPNAEFTPTFSSHDRSQNLLK
jgi:hypothetical protein